MGGPVADVFKVALHLLTGSTALAGFVLHVRGDAVRTELPVDTGHMVSTINHTDVPR